MKTVSVLLFTLLGVSMCVSVAYFSGIVISISDGNFADRLTSIIAGMDANTQGGQIAALKLCKAMFMLGSLLPFAEVLACLLAIVALIIFFVKGNNTISSRLYSASFMLPILVVAPLLLASPLSAYLTRANKVGEAGLGDATGWALFGVLYLLVWIALSSAPFLGASSSMKRS
jgi:hypothetical protein